MHTHLCEEWIQEPVGLGEESFEKVLRLGILVVATLGCGLGGENRLLAALGEVVDIHDCQILDEILRTIYNTEVANPMPDNLSHSDSDMSLGVGWVIAQAALFVFFFMALFSGDTVSGVPGLIVAQVIGLIAALAGALVSVWSLMQHGWRVSPFPRPVDGAQLVESGPYRYVRHPMYSGIVLFTLGVGLAYANPVVLLTSFAFLVFFTAKTGREEEMLVATVSGYRGYRSDVAWRLIPFVI